RRYAVSSAPPDGDAQLTHRGASRCRAERAGQLLAVQQELLTDDGRVRLDDERLALDPECPAGAVGGGRPLRDDRIEGREEPGPAQLIGEAQAGGGVRDERPDPRHRPATSWRVLVLAPFLVHQRARTAPDSPGRTSHGVAIARSAGSRSSSVVVVTNAWGSSAIRRTRWARRAGSSSEKTSSRSRRGWRASFAETRSSSASLRARIAVRCWPREAKAERSRPASTKAASSRCGPMSVVPFHS